MKVKNADEFYKILERKAIYPVFQPIVNLQTGAHSGDSVSSVKVDASNAKNMVADITAMFAKSGNAVQANLNGFDAARLLA